MEVKLPYWKKGSSSSDLMEKAVIYTIGHSNRSIEEFLQLLKSKNVQILVDVRRFPTSRKFPHFSRQNLSKCLEENNIAYVYLGDLLGGFRKGGYVAYMKTNDFKEGMRKLLELTTKGRGRVCIMCAERLWFRCHRRFIAKELERKGVKVIHLK